MKPFKREEELEIYFSRTSKEFLDVVANSNISNIEIRSTLDIADQFGKIKFETLQFLFNEDKSGFRIENEKESLEDNSSFSFDLYRIKNDEFEIRLEIDKNANEEEIRSIISIMEIKMKYTHSE